MSEKSAMNDPNDAKAKMLLSLIGGGLGAAGGAEGAGPGNRALGALAGIPGGLLGGYAGVLGGQALSGGTGIDGALGSLLGSGAGGAAGALGGGYGAGKLVGGLRGQGADKQASLSDVFDYGFVEAISTFSKEAGSFLDRKPDGIGKRIGKTYRRWTDQQTRRDVAEDTYDKTVKRIGNPAEKAKKKVNDWLDSPAKKKEPNTGGIKIPFMPKKPA